ncbi:response regulator [Microbacterium sp. JB110]|uniref:response regulator n=1 Tax=Microbacterium sp. JB110 TaxID=2024477 RepID=UPI00097F43A2|nr:response regulator transcription factor [Microbacterium sp. JB110]RCS57904.1 DNA-binding response regulator [Microbacterium sp. JB110]SJM56349.1 putative two-component system response regulator [Frigoribacterium sp. JB110]
MRILIVEDSVLLREGLTRLLADAGHEVVAALPDATDVTSAVARTVPDLCIVDVRLPPTFRDEGIRAALELRRRDANLAVLVFSQYVEEQYASDLIAQQGGAVGYLLKDRVTDVAEFLESIDRIAEGATVLDPEVVAQLLTRRSRDEKMQRLTERERTVLSLIAEGKNNAGISKVLFISAGAVEKHITSIFQKLDLDQDDQGNRRVLAVLAHIEAMGEPTPAAPQAPRAGEPHQTGTNS